MLLDLIANRDAIFARLAALGAVRAPRHAGYAGAVSAFLEHLTSALHHAPPGDVLDPRPTERIGTDYGTDLAQAGLPIDTLVDDYGDVCHALTALAEELSVAISAGELQVLNACFHDAISSGILAHTRHAGDAEARRLGVIAHDLRNYLGSAMLSFDLIKGGTVSAGGSAGAMLGRSLAGLRDAVNRLRDDQDGLASEPIVGTVAPDVAPLGVSAEPAAPTPPQLSVVRGEARDGTLPGARGHSLRPTAPGASTEPPSQPATGSNAHPPDAASRSTLHQLRVLLVEDDPDARDLLQLVLTKHGAVVTLATNGVEAEPLLVEQPDVVLTDISMPEADGYEVLRATRKVLGRTACIAVTAFASDVEKSRALDAGFDAYFAKPVDYHGLVNALVALRPGMSGATPAAERQPNERRTAGKRSSKATDRGNG